MRIIPIVVIALCIGSYSVYAQSPSDFLHTGLNELYYSDGQLYYLYIPALALQNPEEAYIFATIHGYSGQKNNADGKRQVERAALKWTSLADEYGWVILTPHFDEDRFNSDYQRLNINILGLDARSDLRLNQLVGEVGRLIPGINTDKIYMFGFSGGGQFVHRYVAFHPTRINRAVSAAAGWYMWPDNLMFYPVGTQMFFHSVEPDMDGLLASNLLVLVGTEDTTNSSFRETYGFYDLMEIQGESRYERAINWVYELEQLANQENLDMSVEIKFAENTGHSITSTLKNIAAEYLTEDTIPMVTRLYPWDANADGIVSVSDLIFVGDYLGATVSTDLFPNPDINRDTEVNVLDIILVARHFGEIYSLAAPTYELYTVDPQCLPILTKIHDVVDENMESGNDFALAENLLHRLIDSIKPNKTALLQNYPNPFNPETWIPYQLTDNSEVTLRIYSITGQIIRELDLGYKKAGLHTTKHAAAYWDGYSNWGEKAANGVYYYSIEAGDYNAVRKMTITQ